MESAEEIKTKYLGKSLEQLIEKISLLEQKNAYLNDENTSLRHLLYGSKKEKLAADPPGIKPLFNEVEVISDITDEPGTDDSQNDSDPNQKKKKKKRNRGKRKPLPANLPRVRQEFDLEDDEKTCKEHGVALERIGEAVTEKMDIIPAKIQVIEQVTFTYKCPCCTGNFVKSKKDPEAIPKSMASPGLLAYLVTSKYQDALPLYRLSSIFDRFGIDLDRTTMARWIIKLSKLVQPLINLMHDDTFDRPMVHVDETVIQVLKEPNKRAESKSFIWAMASEDEKPIVLFYYHDNRSSKAAYDLLGGYTGYVVADGYKVYDKLERQEGLILTACLAHVRRKFWTAEKFAKKSAKKGTKILASEALSYIRRLYAIEKNLKGKPPDEKKEIRQEKAKPILEELLSWLKEKENAVLPKSLTGKAISYALNQWEKLIRYCDEGFLPIDNNYIESRIKAFVVGRKNWMFSDTPSGAHASASLYSLVESAKANGIQPFDYLNLIFKELPKIDDINEYEKLLPHKVSQHFELKAYSPKK